MFFILPCFKSSKNPFAHVHNQPVLHSDGNSNEKIIPVWIIFSKKLSVNEKTSKIPNFPFTFQHEVLISCPPLSKKPTTTPTVSLSHDSENDSSDNASDKSFNPNIIVE